MTMPQSAPGAGRLATLRMMAGAFIAAIFLIGLAVSFMIPSETWFAVPTTVSLILPIVAGAAGAFGVIALGHNVPALSSTLSPDAAASAGMNAFQSTFFIRVALSELAAIVGIAASVIDENGSAIPYLIGAVISLVLLGAYAYPSAASVRRIERRLDRDGGHSQLARAFGLSGGAPDGYTGGGTVL